MKDFAQLQSEFQHAILNGDASVLEDILDSPKEARGALFDVYRNAYVLRLVESMRKSFELLHRYMGDEMFDDMGAAYVAQHPSPYPNIRWYGRSLPAFLAATAPYDDHPVLAELSALETALNDAFDSADENVVSLADMSALDPAIWQDLVFVPHASVHRFRFTTNALTIWGMLRDDECVPEVEYHDTPEHVVVWRQEGTAMVRPFGVEEAMMWDEAASGIPFGQLCAMLATYDDPNGAAGRAATYLGGWVNAGMLAGATAV